MKLEIGSIVEINHVGSGVCGVKSRKGLVFEKRTDEDGFLFIGIWMDWSYNNFLSEAWFGKDNLILNPIREWRLTKYVG